MTYGHLLWFIACEITHRYNVRIAPLTPYLLTCEDVFVELLVSMSPGVGKCAV